MGDKNIFISDVYFVYKNMSSDIDISLVIIKKIDFISHDVILGTSSNCYCILMQVLLIPIFIIATL